jgi:hypothetical protein
MTHATSITARSQQVRAIVKIAGVNRYLSNHDVNTYTDAAGGNTHGELTVQPDIVDISYSAGRLDHSRHMVTQSTMTLRVLDSAWLRGLLATNVTPQYLAADAAADALSLQIQDTTGYATAGLVHVGRETITVSAEFSGEVLTVTRAALGTTAEKHPIGTAVSTTPRHWRGRKAWLVLGSNDGSGWAYEDPFQVFRLSASPRYVDGLWEFEFSDGLELSEREFYVGFRDVSVDSFQITTYTGGDGVVYLYVDDVAHFLESSAPTKQGLHVVMTGGATPGCFPVTDVDTDNDRLMIRLDARNLYKPQRAHRFRVWIGAAFGEADDHAMTHNVRHDLASVTARPAYFIRDAQDVVPRVLLSTYGAAADNYDLLPGTAPTSTEIEIRAGAGLTTDEVDATSWALATESPVASSGYLVGIDGPVRVEEFLSRDACPVLGGYWRVSRAGKIQFISYNPTTAGTSADYTITSANTLDTGVNYILDESTIASRVILWTGYDTATQQWARKHIVHYGEQDHVYGRAAQEYEIQSRLAAHGHQEVISAAERYFARWCAGVVRLSVRCPWSACTVQPGDTVSLTSTLLPSPTSGTLGQSAELYEVVSSSPDLQTGTVRLELASTVAAKMISPTALVDSVSGSDAECTMVYGNGDIDTEFAIGWIVQAIAADGTARAGTAAITDLDSGTITLAAGITSLTAGDYIIFADYGTATNTTAATYSGAGQTGFAFISDRTYTSTHANHRWL